MKEIAGVQYLGGFGSSAYSEPQALSEPLFMVDLGLGLGLPSEATL
jgi:hypothetical protein